MIQYLNLVEEILNNGVRKEPARENMPQTIGISGASIDMDLDKGFPLLTTKKLHWKSIVHELLWILKGDTNIKYLIDNGVKIWNDDAYRWYLKRCEDENRNKSYIFSKEVFIEKIKNGELTYITHHNYKSETGYKLGDLGKVYGYQWRNQNGVDQLKDVYDGLISNPHSRYHIIDGWNKADFNEMALPPCHLLYQFYARPIPESVREEIMYTESINNMHFPLIVLEELIPKYCLDLVMYQRSADTFLGVPYNLASMSLFLKIMSKATNMIPGVAKWRGGDVHLYENHIEQAKEQLSRTPYALPEVKITKYINSFDDMVSLEFEDIVLADYKHHPAIKAELSTGLKK